MDSKLVIIVSVQVLLKMLHILQLEQSLQKQYLQNGRQKLETIRKRALPEGNGY